jgi:predicted aspartyl protease
VCDTGARMSLLNKSTADRLGLNVSNEQLLISTYTGEKVKVLGL